MSMWWGKAPVNEQRWVVLDVETSGLDPHHDRLLAVAAVAVHRHGSHWRLSAGDAFEVVLRQPPARQVDKDNILLHGIGLQDQQSGVWPEQALKSLKSYLGDSPWMGFHAPFDHAFMARAARAAGVTWTIQSWLDLYDLRASFGVQPLPSSLDEALRHAGIEVAQRHHAMADAWATAELWLYVWPRLRQQGMSSWQDISRLARHARWLRRAE
ncbi:MAG: polymerase PolC-type [Pseudomonadota bacterium]|jgi:DNA polymerase III subunit epsilon